MFSNDDDSSGVVMGVIFGVIALVISLIIGLTIYTKNKAAKAMAVPAAVTAPASGLAGAAGVAAGAAAGAGAAAAGVTAAKSDEAMALAAQAAANAASVKVENGVVNFYFASGKFDLAAGGAQALAEIAAGVKAGKKAVVSGYVDNTGNADQNKEIAKQRAFGVRDLLKSIGVPEDKIELKKPSDIQAGTGAQARRVEVSLQ